MQLEHSFTVPADLDTVWQAVLDPERVAPCMPGATLTEVEGSSFSGTVKVKLGPISLLYKGSGEFLETDEQARRLVIKASGKDSKGNGTAAATVTVSLRAEGGATAGSVVTDLTVTGKPAQFGRGMISEVGGKILDTFARCLAEKLATGPAEAAGGPPAGPADVGDAGGTGTSTVAGSGTAGGNAKAAGTASAAAASPASDPSVSGTEAPAGSGKSAGTVGAEAGRAAAEAVSKAEAGRPVGTAQERPQLSVVEPASSRPTENGAQRRAAEPETEPIDLLSYAGPSVAKRAAPLVVVALLVLFIVLRRRRSR